MKTTFTFYILLAFLQIPTTAFAQMTPFAFYKTQGPQYRNTAVAVSQSSATSIVIAKPTGTVAKDVLYAFLWTNDYDSTASVTTPAGWTSLGSQSHQTNQYVIWVFRRVADGSEAANFTFSFSESVNYSAGTVVAYSGVNVNTPEDAAPVFTIGNVSTGTVNFTGLTITNHYSRVILCTFETSRASTLTAPSGFAQKVSNVDTGNAQSVYLFDRLYVSPQATGTLSTTGWNTSSNRYLGVALSLRAN
jgi:hypothetical protein